MDSLQSIKQRFGIIGNNIGLNRSLEKAIRVSSTDISVLVHCRSFLLELHRSLPQYIWSAFDENIGE